MNNRQLPPPLASNPQHQIPYNPHQQSPQWATNPRTPYSPQTTHCFGGGSGPSGAPGMPQQFYTQQWMSESRMDYYDSGVGTFNASTVRQHKKMGLDSNSQLFFNKIILG